MRLLFTIVICALSLNARAQSNNPYFNPDYNGDSFIGVDDILGALSAYDNYWIPNAEAIHSGVMSWTCGDPWNHQGYWYSTIEIGEQCWFKENLRATSFTDNFYATEFLDSCNVNEVWANATSPLWGYSFHFWHYHAAHSWNTDPSNSLHADINHERGSDRGLLYNWYAVNSVENLCPTGWHVSNYSDWVELTATVSQTLEDISMYGVDISMYVVDEFGTLADNLGNMLTDNLGDVGDELKSGNFNGGFMGDTDDPSIATNWTQHGDWALSEFSALATSFRSSPLELGGMQIAQNMPENNPGAYTPQRESAQWWIADTVITPNSILYPDSDTLEVYSIEDWDEDGIGDTVIVSDYIPSDELGLRVRIWGTGKNGTDALRLTAAEKYSGYSVRCVKGCDIHPQCCDCWCYDSDVDEDGICDSVDDCIPDAIGVCGGECEWDEDGDGICDEEED